MPRRRWPAVLAAVLVVAVAALGVALLLQGRESFDRASESRDRADAYRRHRRTLIARTEQAEQVTDAPISGAERVANSVGTVVEATDAVIIESGATNQLLSDAVQRANAGDRGGADRIYDGEAAASVRRLQESLTRAQAALRAAEQAAADLDAATR
jgi:hypothetical protein